MTSCGTWSRSDAAAPPHRRPWNRISSEKARVLLDLIGGEEPSAVIPPTEPVRRQSA
ncbi:hypothetical protein LJ221_01070 [Streptomyces sp. CNQ085]|nr:hypothetical protein [Streptomyces sp. CNQ085]MCI0383041.1 hypothetical protein [Streptomyces sp. CNQ085]